MLNQVRCLSFVLLLMSSLTAPLAAGEKEFEQKWARALFASYFPESYPEERVGQLFEEAMNAAGASKDLVHASLGDYVSEPTESLQHFRSAVSITPKLIYGWYQIYMHPESDPKLKKQARENMLRFDPGNAYPHILGAFESIEKAAIPEALDRVQAAYGKSFSIL